MLLTPKYIRSDVVEHVREGSPVIKSEETREEFRERYPFKYIIKLFYEDFDKPLFVEMCLENPDPDYPEVRIVSVHPDGV